MGVALWAAERALLPVSGGALVLLAALGGLAALAGVVYLLLLDLLGVRDGRQVLGIFRERIGRARSA